MAKSILTIIISIISLNTIGQNDSDYIRYYNLITEGGKQKHLNNDSLALELYIKAFSLVDYVHAQNYEKAAMLAARNNRFDLAYIFSKKAVLHGCHYSFFKGKSFEKYRTTDYYKQFSDSLEIFKKQHTESINLKYKQEIDSLYYIDQRIIRNNRSVKGDYNLEALPKVKNKFDLDSLIFKHLLALIEKYGFPSEQNIGIKGYNNANILVHHNFRLPENEEYLPMAKEALFKGFYKPFYYAFMYEQSRSLNNEKPYFYYWDYLENLTENEKATINKRRREYGLKPIESYTEKKRWWGSIIKYSLW